MSHTQHKISVSGVTRVYTRRSSEGAESRFTALENISLTVRAGEFLTIVGSSGCGKSTLLDLIAGLAAPTAGELFIDGKKITGPALDRGIVMQGYALFPWRTVRRNVEFGLEIKKVPKKQRGAISDHFLQLVGLGGFADRYPYELSGGMKQRVAIARALAYDPEVLLMDEPFAAVDAQTRETLQDELLQIWEKTGKTIIFVTHSIDEAVALADRVVVLSPNPGRVREIVPVPLERPRRVADAQAAPEYSRIRHRVWELLQAGGEATGVQPEAAVSAYHRPEAAPAEERLPVSSVL
ncbi:ABC transporter ATP-binding protein [Paenibacillus tepidiphilus]|uniref:ABC transporter ATP-binding protein n=1 Tax=Paenibacillus tepidiphilus TaxID=2608683 RepID=UPI00123BC3BC|nr:ABC transporter ATP-binding protein [Paenibacillus tepidiphilus]